MADFWTEVNKLHPALRGPLIYLKQHLPSLTIVSGYRSYQEQAALWEKYGRDPNRVAPPGRSRHNYGLAVDLAMSESDWAKFRQMAPQLGLVQPMAHEPWHWEPSNAGELMGTGYTPGVPTYPQLQLNQIGYQPSEMNYRYRSLSDMVRYYEKASRGGGTPSTTSDFGLSDRRNS